MRCHVAKRMHMVVPDIAEVVSFGRDTWWRAGTLGVCMGLLLEKKHIRSWIVRYCRL